ncbi:MAG: hypothetical protein JWN86_2654 [Planctomycetota bacterium]|nr:hypothetical protein [Planctomycetota bacterium]
MIRSRLLSLLVLSCGIAAAVAGRSFSQEPPDAKPNGSPSGAVRVVEPITDLAIQQIRESVLPFLDKVSRRPAGPDGKKPEPIVVFEFLPGDKDPGKSPLGVSNDLARFLTLEITHSERTKGRTVAYVPQPLKGYAVLAVLACDEIVMGPDASLGPITPDGQPVDDVAVAAVQTLAKKKGRESERALFLGMVDKTLDVHLVKTADNQVHFVLGRDLAAFGKEHQVSDSPLFWEGGTRGVLKAESARDHGVASRVLDDLGAVRKAYGMDSTAYLAALDSESGELIFDGPITRGDENVARRYLAEQVANKKTSRIFIRLRSPGGDERAITLIAQELSDLKGIETVAYVEEEARGLASLIPLACDKIVFKQGATMGDAGRAVSGRNGNDEINEAVIARAAEEMARKKGHPAAIARAMVDSQCVVVQVNDNQTGAVVALLDSEVKAGRHTIQATIKPAGEVLTLTADAALSLGLATQVVKTDEELWSSFGLSKPPKSAKASWVDNLVATLNSPWMSGLLLFIGLFMLILELKLPGIGLPAIISALAFLLFFWSHYLGGTADQLEILLFLVGVVCLALELFVFPGFAVFGLSGILLILVSVIMASHTFVWPTQEYEYHQMSQTMMEVTGAILTVSVAAVVVGRYFPHMPLFRRMVLVPPDLSAGPDTPDGKPRVDDGEFSLFFLLGEVGRTTTALKPTGKARFGEMLVDVIADGFYIERDSEVEVVEVQGSKVIVKKA